jgi:segregation and condensation protein B
MYQIKIEKFEGPFDLLLQMIEKEEMNITEISLAKIADQFVLHIERMENLNPAEMADFLVVAAKLLWIKSKALLPSLEIEGEDDSELATQLKIYKEYRDASLVIHKMILKRHFTFVRERPPLGGGDILFNPPAWLTKDKLVRVMREILDDLEPIVRLPRGMVKNTISIQEKIQHIRDLIQKNLEVKFHTIVSRAKNKVEIVVHFLAVLELLKHGHIIVKQEEIFGEINIANLKSKIESLLFVASRPLSLKKICEQTGGKKEETVSAMNELAEEYKRGGRGIQVMEIDGEYQMSTNGDFSKMVKDFLKDEMTGELTRPALETLTIVAYRGPIAKSELEQIRGVNCSLILRNLMIKGLVESKGSDKGGEPLFNITFDFMRYLGITKQNNLPDYDKLSKSEILNKILNLSTDTTTQDKVIV